MNNYLITYKKEECNGCGICSMCCPVDAIHMVEDNEGFYYPEINKSKCINCGKCKKICSNYNNSNNNEDAYMAINKSVEELKNSASGGVFFVLARYVIENNGVVFGVEYGEKFKVQHNHYEVLEECKKFQGSKYLRSDVRDSYKEVKEFLEQDRYVLFTGTPCQCNALKVYLNKEYDKLILCDIICHANPSQKVFNKYIEELEEKKNKKVKNFCFRSKENGWRNQTPIIEFEDGEKVEENTFFKAFVRELIGRPSCHDCKFSGINRCSDFTIGDFWGINKILPNIKDDNTGISLVTINTDKAKKIFEEIKDNLELIKVKKEEGFRYNHHSNVPMHKKREEFFRDFESKSVIKNMKDCLKESIFKKIFRKCKKIIFKIIKK